MKYHQSYLMRRFRNLEAVHCWVDGFVEWYNSEHRHSGIKYVTPNQRHFGEANEICANRQQTYERAFQENPRRWSRPPRSWKQPEVVKINYSRPEKDACANRWVCYTPVAVADAALFHGQHRQQPRLGAGAITTYGD